MAQIHIANTILLFSYVNNYNTFLSSSGDIYIHFMLDDKNMTTQKY